MILLRIFLFLILKSFSMKYNVFFAFIFSALACFSQEKYSRIKIYTGTEGLSRLHEQGLPVDHGTTKKNHWIITELSETEIQKVNDLGFKYEIIIGDMVWHYQTQSERTSSSSDGICNPIDYPVPINFKLGSMGGYFTYNEMLTHLDSMALKYPNLITVKQQTGDTTSIEGRIIWNVKISDNPNIEEGEKQILYTAIHHAREAASMSQLIFYMYYLLENYDNDPQVKYIVDNNELYFVPCVNPDGYIYNELTNPSGGGMWRKNRRDNNDGTFGVDLNRNYDYYWGFDNTGSSPNSQSDTYRGTMGFSEPELIALKQFTTSHKIKIAINNHTYGNLLIYPWGYQNSFLTPDSATYSTFAKFMTSENQFKYGTGDQTVGYVTNGDSDDWMYGDTTLKPAIFSMTPESGNQSDGFWPASDRIIDICKSNIRQNLNVALLLNPFFQIKDLSSQWIENDSAYIKFNYSAVGLGSDSFTVSILNNQFIAGSSGKINGLFEHLDTKTDSIEVFLFPGIATGTTFDLVFKTESSDYTYYDTIHKFYGPKQLIFSDNFLNPDNWTGDWGMDDGDFISAPFSFSDSPGSDYSGSDSKFTSINIDLTGQLNPVLNFNAKWDIEKGYDYVQILVSEDNGNIWTPLCGKFTVSGTADQKEGEPVYDGIQDSWVREEISLGQYSNKNIMIGFNLVSDLFVTGDGYFVDDLEIISMPATATGILSKKTQGVTFYPGYCVITNPEFIKFHFELIDILGRTVKAGTVINNIVNYEEVPAGIYYLKLSGKEMENLKYKIYR